MPEQVRRPRTALWALLLVFCTAALLPGCRERADSAVPPANPGAAASMGGGDRTNIVVILTDDQRADSLGCTGAPWARTPNIDRLAREGVLFENAFVITSLCCPSRATFLTGQYAHVHGVSGNAMEIEGVGSPYLPESLKKHGYATAFIGKYHLGGGEQSAAPRSGFDYWAGVFGQGSYERCWMNVNGRQVTTREDHYLTDVLAGMAAEWIQQQESTPFFLLLALTSPHFPLDPPGRHGDLYGDQLFPVPESFADPLVRLPREVQRITLPPGDPHGSPEGLQRLLRSYARMIPSIDDAVGAVYRALEDEGILDRTLIIFTSDNGHLSGEHHVLGKGLAYEASIRVPLIIRYPGGLPRATRDRHQVLNIDLPPTILEAAGTPTPPSMQGRSLFNLFGQVPRAWRQDWLYVGPYPQAESPPLLAIRNERWKYVRYRRDLIEEELFDLRLDPEERHNLRDDPAHRSELDAARTRMQALIAQVRGPARWWEPTAPMVDLPE